MKCKAFLVCVFLLVSLVLPLYQMPKVKAQESKVFGNLDLPDWLNVTVSELPNFIIVDNGDGFVWEFSKDKDKFNQVYENGTLIVKDEQWLLIGSDLKEDSHPIGLLEWEQPKPYHVIVKDFYQDIKKNNNFTVIYDFYGGFHPKITFNASIGTAQNYTVDWRCWVHKLNAINEPEKHRVKFWNENETGVVFSYEDVYMSFGNITDIDVEGWFKGKRFDEKFNVGYLNGTFTLDPSFGYTTEGTTGVRYINDYIRGPHAAPVSSGTADSISWYGYSESISKIKCALYFQSNGSFIAETEEIDYIDESYDYTWHTHNFDTPPNIVLNTEYWIVAWANATSYMWFDTGDTDVGKSDSETYNSFPDPIGGYTETKEYSIFCNYTVEEEGEAYVSDLSQSLSTTWSVLTEWDAIADFTQGLTTSWSVLTEWNAILDVTQSLTTSWNILANLNTFVDLSQVLSTTWSVLIGWNAILDLGQALSTTWQIILSHGMFVDLSLSNTFTWTVDILKSVVVAHIVDLTLTVVTSWIVDVAHTPWISYGPPSTFGTLALVIAIVSLALVVTLITKKRS